MSLFFKISNRYNKEVFKVDKRILTVILGILALILDAMKDDE